MGHAEVRRYSDSGLDIPLLESAELGPKRSAELEIAHYPWDVNGYRPKVLCRIYAILEELRIRFISYERKIRATETRLNGEVYRDSCVEFFFQPTPASDSRYFNFEINPLGTMLVGLGSGRPDRSRLNVENYRELFQVETTVQPYMDYRSESWEVSFRIPGGWIREYFPDFSILDGHVMRGNFYKCGEAFEYPHYGCWNEIRLEKPDFHRSEFFAPIRLCTS